MHGNSLCSLCLDMKIDELFITISWCELCIHSSLCDNFSNLEMLNSPLDYGIASVCHFFLWDEVCVFLSSHHTFKFLIRGCIMWKHVLGEQLISFNLHSLNSMFHVNSWAWVFFFLTKKLSSPFGETLMSCRTWVYWRCRYFVLDEHVPIKGWVCEDNFMLRSLSHDVNVYFHCCNVCWGCVRPYQII